MKSTVFWTLIVVNVVLLLSFIGRVMHENSAMAQNARTRPGDYLMIPAEIQGSTNGIVVVLDQTDGTLSAISYDDSNNRFDMMPKMDLAKVLNAASAPVPAPRGNR
jgi:hypothetical protein